MTAAAHQPRQAGNEPALAVIIPHYNDLTRLEKCLKALSPQVPEHGVEVVVVDNGTPGGLALITAGALMAGIYPVGMKIAVGWGQADRGFLVGMLVGALTLGHVPGRDRVRDLLLLDALPGVGPARVRGVDVVGDQAAEVRGRWRG